MRQNNRFAHAIHVHGLSTRVGAFTYIKRQENPFSGMEAKYDVS
jgi:hypothetical protein